MGQHFKAAQERRRQAHNDRAWLAHTVAVLGKQKKPQALSTLQVAGEAKPRRRMSPEDRMSVVQQWGKAVGR